MLTLKLDDTGDIVLASGQLQMVSGPEEIAQSCRLILGVQKGEWFLNPELGIDHRKFLGKGVSRDELQDEIMSGLLQEPRVQTVDSITFEVDRKLRRLVISFTATGTDGEIITAEGVEIGG
ncbi:hypothetical protein P40081_28470 [Paenibacillus sp. FSL P4-0081]|uniref:DUF2634 domain-containing protein n=1 Tax=Paenibacillus sp. FSL P4-0081 TaxID=1536769 RepID=UPI0004F59B42|nr:DUF2634 domain-containing protein [Paenibacillus sp. FSL P4-0081]AIQ31631.1 hypothetical protein P40081_28470 [Paenibacillus sp. FSL P4-0081]